MLGLSRRGDAWLAYQYDMAAGRLGMYCAAKLAETDKQGQPLYDLALLLSDAAAKGQRPLSHYRTDDGDWPVEYE